MPEGSSQEDVLMDKGSCKKDLCCGKGKRVYVYDFGVSDGEGVGKARQPERER